MLIASLAQNCFNEKSFVGSRLNQAGFKCKCCFAAGDNGQAEFKLNFLAHTRALNYYIYT
jgi:hypothetical protein